MTHPGALLAAVAIGGALGSVARWGVGLALNRPGLPLGTLLANLLGCAAMGLLVGLADGAWDPPEPWRSGLRVGVLGGFTTFSAFAAETLSLGEAAPLRAAAYAALTVAGTLLGVWLGLLAGRASG